MTAVCCDIQRPPCRAKSVNGNSRQGWHTPNFKFGLRKRLQVPGFLLSGKTPVRSDKQPFGYHYARFLVVNSGVVHLKLMRRD